MWVDGDGPPLVLVHGSMCDHTGFDPLVAELRDGMATFAMDRRGFGASGDAGGYSIERDFEDVVAVVDTVAEPGIGQLALWGHSYGAGCAMGAAALTSNVRQLIPYEPGLGLTYPTGAIQAIEEALAAGDREAAIFMAFGALPLTEESWTYRPRQFDAVTARTSMLTGSKTCSRHPDNACQARAVQVG